MVGTNFGYRIGPGVLFFDVRGYYNLIETIYESVVTSSSDPSTIKYGQTIYYGHRMAGSINFSIGYEIGLLPKARR